MIIWVNRFLLRKGFSGMALWPFVILRHESQLINQRFMNHERIHLLQQIELLILFFYLWYVIEFFIRWAQYQNRRKAYRNISFEREAYQNEKDPHYLKRRPYFHYLKYI